MNEHQPFLDMVKAYVDKHPDAAPFVTSYVADGLQAHLNRQSVVRADLEVLVHSLASSRFDSYRRELCISKLEHLEEKQELSLNFASLLEALKGTK